MFSFQEGTNVVLLDTYLDRNDDPIDLTSATSLQVRVYYQPKEATTVVLTLTVANGGLVVASAVAGQVNMVIEPNELDAGDYTYEASCITAASNTLQLARGELHVTPSFGLAV